MWLPFDNAHLSVGIVPNPPRQHSLPRPFHRIGSGCPFGPLYRIEELSFCRHKVDSNYPIRRGWTAACWSCVCHEWHRRQPVSVEFGFGSDMFGPVWVSLGSTTEPDGDSRAWVSFCARTLLQNGKLKLFLRRTPHRFHLLLNGSMLSRSRSSRLFAMWAIFAIRIPSCVNLMIVGAEAVVVNGTLHTPLSHSFPTRQFGCCL